MHVIGSVHSSQGGDQGVAVQVSTSNKQTRSAWLRYSITSSQYLRHQFIINVPLLDDRCKKYSRRTMTTHFYSLDSSRLARIPPSGARTNNVYLRRQMIFAGK